MVAPKMLGVGQCVVYTESETWKGSMPYPRETFVGFWALPLLVFSQFATASTSTVEALLVAVIAGRTHPVLWIWHYHRSLLELAFCPFRKLRVLCWCSSLYVSLINGNDANYDAFRGVLLVLTKR